MAVLTRGKDVTAAQAHVSVTTDHLPIVPGAITVSALRQEGAITATAAPVAGSTSATPYPEFGVMSTTLQPENGRRD